MKLTRVSAIAALVLALGAGTAFAVNLGVNTSANVGVQSGKAEATGNASGAATVDNSSVNGTGSLGVAISKAGDSIDTQKSFYASLSAAQQDDVRARCNAALGASASTDPATLTASEKSFCEVIVH